MKRGLILTPSDMAFLDGLLDLFSPLPDGAWQVACEDMIKACGRFNQHDSFDVWIEWIERTSEGRQREA